MPLTCVPLTEDPRLIVRRHLAEPVHAWSVGTWGAIGEFEYDADEPGLVVDPDRLMVSSARGSLQIGDLAGVRCFAITDEAGRKREIAFCTKRLGAGRRAIRQLDELTFDLGIGAPHIDLLVRLQRGDSATGTALGRSVGRGLLDADSPAAAAVARASPTRIFVSAVARLEVHQPIPPPGGVSPQGPHSHLLPTELQEGRPHSPGSPLPEGWYCGLSLYPRPWRA